MWSSVKNVLLWIWQIPQNILAICLEGIICQGFYRNDKLKSKTIIYNNVLPSGLSLGDYIFVNNYNEYVIKHELGHCKQSEILGPLYLVVIGIPSLLHNIIHRIFSLVGVKWNYYSFYTESWANKLAKLN